jgi:hypothetical protein
MNNPATCKHGNFNFRTTVGRFPEQGNFVVAMNMACSECGTAFYWYGITATGDPTASCPTVSDDKRQLQIYVGPEKESWEIPDRQRAI